MKFHDPDSAHALFRVPIQYEYMCIDLFSFIVQCHAYSWYWCMCVICVVCMSVRVCMRREPAAREEVVSHTPDRDNTTPAVPGMLARLGCVLLEEVLHSRSGGEE